MKVLALKSHFQYVCCSYRGRNLHKKNANSPTERVREQTGRKTEKLTQTGGASYKKMRDRLSRDHSKVP